jgi:hypothetical protein
MEEVFKEGWWWISYPDSEDPNNIKYYLGYFTSPDDLYEDEIFELYLGETYFEFLGRFKIKAS